MGMEKGEIMGNGKTGPRVVFPILFLLVILMMTLFAVWLAARAAPRPVWMLDFDIGRVLGQLLLLFVVALFVERAAEVIIGVWREPGRARLKHEATAIGEKPTAAGAPAGGPGYDAGQKLAAYQADTGRIAVTLTFLLGMAAAVVGIRALLPLVDQTTFRHLGKFQTGLFHWLDAVVTGAVIGGGAEGIHHVMEALIGAFEAVRGYLADKGQKASTTSTGK